MGASPGFQSLAPVVRRVCGVKTGASALRFYVQRNSGESHCLQIPALKRGIENLDLGVETPSPDMGEKRRLARGDARSDDRTRVI